VSSSDVRKSTKDPDLQVDRSVYDFLYYDARRVGSFLAQFDPAGHLQQYRRTDTVGSSVDYSAQTKGSGGIGVLNASVSTDERGGDHESQISDRSYDPLWTNALNFLDFLSERDLLNRNVDASGIGQFVLVSGSLDVVDLTLVREMWKLPSIAAAVAVGASQEQPIGNRKERRAGRGGAKPPQDHEVALDMLKVIPHSVQATISTENASIWSTLREDGLIVSGSDLFLKHGRQIPGEWHMLGILDATPSNKNQDQIVSAEDAAVGLLGGLGFVLDAIGPFARLLLGRPSGSYSLTPLLIFRRAGWLVGA